MTTTTTPPAPIALLPFPTPEEAVSLPYVSLLPCHIEHDGPAPIASYFPTRPHVPSPSTSSQPTESLEAAYRGRLLVSTPFHVPEGYTGLVFTTSTPAPASASVGVASTLKPKVTIVEEEPKRKRVKLTNVDEEGKAKKPLFSDGPVLRRSPRKKPVVQKFSLDSDEEEEEEEEEADDSGRMEVEAAIGDDEGVVLLETTTTTTVVEEVSETMTQAGTAANVLVADGSQTSLPGKTLVGSTPESEITSFSFTTTDTQTSIATTVVEEEAKEEKIEVDVADTEAEEEQEEEEEAALARDVQYLVPTATFSTIQIWNADYQLDTKEDLYGKTLTEWIGIANKIHAY